MVTLLLRMMQEKRMSEKENEELQFENIECEMPTPVVVMSNS